MKMFRRQGIYLYLSTWPLIVAVICYRSLVFDISITANTFDFICTTDCSLHTLHRTISECLKFDAVEMIKQITLSGLE